MDFDDVPSVVIAWIRHFQAAVTQISLTAGQTVYCSRERGCSDNSGRHRDPALSSWTRRHYSGLGTARPYSGRRRPDEVDLLAAHRLEHRDMLLWVSRELAFQLPLFVAEAGNLPLLVSFSLFLCANKWSVESLDNGYFAARWV